MAESKNQMGGLAIVALLLAAATGIIHLTLLFPDPIFILNGLGYLGLTGALYLPFSPFRGAGWLRWVLIAYTAVTIILYVVMSITSGGPNPWTLPLGPITKAIEVILIAVLLLDRRSA